MLLGTFVLLAVGAGNAQDLRALKVKVPFAFSVGKQSFPAGNYSLKPSSNTHTMFLRDQSGRVLTSVATNSVETTDTPTAPKLIFNGHSVRYVLVQIRKPSLVEIGFQRAPGSTSGRLVTR
jgi:hypothetical protein